MKYQSKSDEALAKKVINKFLELDMMPEVLVFSISFNVDTLNRDCPDFINELTDTEQSKVNNVFGNAHIITILQTYLENYSLATIHSDSFDGDSLSLTENGKKLREFGDLDTYFNFITSDARKETERRKESDRISRSMEQISRRQLWVNLCIALAGLVAAVYYISQLIIFHQQEEFSSEPTFYLVLGIFLGLLLAIPLSYIIPQLWPKHTATQERSEDKTT